MQNDACGIRISDQELLRRIDEAKSTQRRFRPDTELDDPIEHSPSIAPIIREVERRAKKFDRFLKATRPISFLDLAIPVL